MTNKKQKITPLKRLLWEQGLSQSQFAADTGINYVYLNRIANGWNTPSTELQNKICKYLNTELNELFDTCDSDTESSKREDNI